MTDLLQPRPILEDAGDDHAWRAFEADPGPLVFLVGSQRSGTTWLHLQLARTGAFRYLSAYDVYAEAGGAMVRNHRLGLTEEAKAAFEAHLAGAAAHRGIDAIPARADTPEEYGLVIGRGQLRYNEPDTTAASLPRLRELCAKKALLEGRERPLLLKSPPDYPSGLPILSAAWPKARFIAIQRHPLDILQSQVNAWRELVLRPNPYLLLLEQGYRELFNDPRRRMQQALFLHSPAGVAWLADCILQAQLGFLEWMDAGGDGRLLTLRYEDLCADQAGAFARIARFLDRPLPSPDLAPAPRERTVTPEVQAAYEARETAFRPFLERFGYGPTERA